MVKMLTVGPKQCVSITSNDTIFGRVSEGSAKPIMQWHRANIILRVTHLNISNGSSLTHLFRIAFHNICHE